LEQEPALLPQAPDFAFGSLRRRLQRFWWLDRLATKLIEPGQESGMAGFSARSCGSGLFVSFHSGLTHHLH
jgi:hypothetical protein